MPRCPQPRTFRVPEIPNLPFGETSLDCNFDSLRSVLFGFRQVEEQNTFLEFGLQFRFVDVFWQCERTSEAPIGSLDTVEALAFFFLFLLTLAADAQYAILYCHLDALPIYFRDLRFNEVLGVGFGNIYGRRPVSHAEELPAVIPPRPPGQHAIEVFAQVLQLLEGVPTKGIPPCQIARVLMPHTASFPNLECLGLYADLVQEFNIGISEIGFKRGAIFVLGEAVALIPDPRNQGYDPGCDSAHKYNSRHQPSENHH